MDKHIDDRLWKILGDNFEAEPSGYFNFEKAIPQIKALITTEQLAILEGLPITGIIGKDGIRRDYVPIEASQQQIDSIKQEDKDNG